MATNLAHDDPHGRSEARDEVYHRARATAPDGNALYLLIVNVSPHGLMARCEQPFAAGERLRVILPKVGLATAEVRWALGGRIGCKLEEAIPHNSYYELLAAMG